MHELAGKHIVLGLSAGVACYKAAELCRLLVTEGASVQVVMTEAARQFIPPVTMQALSGRPVYGSQWDEREGDGMPPIHLSRKADAMLIAPFRAHFLPPPPPTPGGRAPPRAPPARPPPAFVARLAQGRADELLSLACLARPAQRVP